MILEEGENGLLLLHLGLLRIGPADLLLCPQSKGGETTETDATRRVEDSSQHTELVEEVAGNQLLCVLFPLTCLYPHSSLFSVFGAKEEQRASLKLSGKAGARK